MKTLEYPNERLYVTARATVSTAAFKAGEFVKVEYYWTDENGVAWYLCNGAVTLPKNHLTQFCL